MVSITKNQLETTKITNLLRRFFPFSFQSPAISKPNFFFVSRWINTKASEKNSGPYNGLKDTLKKYPPYFKKTVTENKPTTSLTSLES